MEVHMESEYLEDLEEQSNIEQVQVEVGVIQNQQSKMYQIVQ